MAVRDMGHQAGSFQRPAPSTGHVRFGPGFIEEYESFRIEAQLRDTPQIALQRHVRTLLLGGLEYFFLMSGAIAEGHGRGSPCSGQSAVVPAAHPVLGRASA